jgi:transcriptional regulator with XRE-family HTH domain
MRVMSNMSWKGVFTLMTGVIPNRMTVNSQEEQFFKAMGLRIAQARKMKGLTQQQMADQLGIAQQTYAHYEVGDVRVPAFTLPVLGELLDMTPNELLGQENHSRKTKPGPPSKLELQIERLRQLPKTKQQLLIAMLDAALAQAGH